MYWLVQCTYNHQPTGVWLSPSNLGLEQDPNISKHQQNVQIEEMLICHKRKMNSVIEDDSNKFTVPLAK
jgi:hypothetical protein